MSERRDALLKGFNDNATFMKETVESNIRLHRMGNRQYHRLTRPDGTPIANAEVTPQPAQPRLQLWLQPLYAGRNGIRREKTRAIRSPLPSSSTMPSSLSTGGIWSRSRAPRYEKGQSQIYRRPAPDLCGILSKTGYPHEGHCLVYPGWTPGWMPKDVRQQKNSDPGPHRRGRQTV